MEPLQPCDKIVDLGAMLRSVTTATGGVSTALLLWLAKQSGALCILGFLLGAGTGVLVGQVLSRVLYPSTNGHTTIVKATLASLPVTLRVALIGAACQTLLVLVVLGATGKIGAWPLAVLVAAGVNMLVAVTIARLSLS